MHSENTNRQISTSSSNIPDGKNKSQDYMRTNLSNTPAAPLRPKADFTLRLNEQIQTRITIAVFFIYQKLKALELHSKHKRKTKYEFFGIDLFGFLFSLRPWCFFSPERRIEVRF